VKFRILAAVTVSAALALSLSGAEAATPVMDGKKVKVITIKGTGGQQLNDKDYASIGGPERVDCQPPRCSKTKFVYKPAKGVRGGLLLTATWSKPVNDFDLYLGVLDKRGNVLEVANCGGALSTNEKVYAAPGELKSGSTYVMIVDHYRSLNEAYTAKIEITVPNPIKTTGPAKVDELAFVNCTL
jgi:hypothetical protein